MDANSTQTPMATPGLSLVCASIVSPQAVLIASFMDYILSFIILLILFLIKKRRQLSLNCCYGYPGIAVPLDFLIAPRHRWIYVAIFGVMGARIFSTFQALNGLTVSSNRYAQQIFRLLVLPLIVIALNALQFSPLFACVDASFTLIGHILGLIYSMLWYALILVNTIGLQLQNSSFCTGDISRVNPGAFTVALLQHVPLIVMGGCVVIWYLYQVVAGIVLRIRRAVSGGDRHQFRSYIKQSVVNNSPRFSDTCRGYYIKHVKRLLKKEVDSTITQGKAKRILKRVMKYLLPYDKHYRLPVPFLGAIAAILLLLYPFSFTIGIFGVGLSRVGVALFDNLLVGNVSQSVLGASSVILLRDILGGILIGFPVVTAMSPILAYITVLLILIHMIGSISKVMKQTLKKGFSEPLPGTVRRLPSSWKFIGLFIGLCFVAWVLYFVVYFIIGIAIGGFILLLRFPVTRPWMIDTAIVLVMTNVWAELVFWGQFFLCKYGFIADKDGKFVAITNRNLFNWFALCLFFYNGLAGFIKAIQRIAFSAGIGLLLLFRLDYVVIAQKFAFLDKGHRAFLCFFYLDYAYNNPVVHCFIKVLKESLYDNPSVLTDGIALCENEESLENGTKTSKVYPRQKIRNRWLVAYTLIRNPKLRKLTSSNLNANKSDDDFFEFPEKEVKLDQSVAAENAIL